LAGVPINAIKEYAGHASIIETQRYLKFMPQSVELAASVSARLAALANVDMDSINGKKAVDTRENEGGRLQLRDLSNCQGFLKEKTRNEVTKTP
jgi:hypothetical protein